LTSFRQGILLSSLTDLIPTFRIWWRGLIGWPIQQPRGENAYEDLYLANGVMSGMAEQWTYRCVILSKNLETEGHGFVYGSLEFPMDSFVQTQD